MPIFDQGYQHWQGELSGHGWRWLAVTRHGVRSLFKSWIVRLLLLLAWLPAVVLVGFLTMWGLLEQQAESVITFFQRLLPADLISQPQAYRSAVWTVAYSVFFKAELYFSHLLVLFIGPNLVSRDLRFNAFPLYFSRPLRRIDYFLGKLGVIGFFLAATMIVPAVGAYLLGLAFSLDLGVIRDTYRLLIGSILYGLVVSVSAGTLMLALSSLSRRSIYVGLAWAGLLVLSLSISSALIGINGGTERRQIVQNGIGQWIRDNPPPPGVEMRGSFPQNRFGPQRRDGPNQLPTDGEAAREKWIRQWSEAYGALTAEAETLRLAQGHTDWRPVLSYTYNLSRMADLFLDVDSAWVLLGRTIERPRAALGPLVKGKGVPGSNTPINDRRLADTFVWQFPWYWSAGTLVGIGIVSVFVLSRRVKSLDRLK